MTNWKDWIIPLSEETLTVAESIQQLKTFGASQDDIPLIIRLVENPKFDLPWIDIFPGAVDLHTHDHIHVLLGRGLLAADEAFVIGFTMGSTNRTGELTSTLFSWTSKYLYPEHYQFDDEALAVYRDAVMLGRISNCLPLDEIDFSLYQQHTLAEARAAFGIEVDLLKAYYRIEQQRYPNSFVARRLL